MRDLLDGQLANTAFAVFAPDGKTRLTSSARSPQSAFGRRSLQSGLQQITEKYPGRGETMAARTPDFTTVREAINLSACDERPLVLAWGADEADTELIEAQLRELAWTPDFVGRLHWDLTADEEFRALIPNAPAGARGLIVVKPEPFGRTATVLTAIDFELEPQDQRTMIRRAMAEFDATFEKLPYEDHVQRGLRLGIVWTESIRMSDRNDAPSRRR